jgi:hypothetical protein
MTITIMLTRVLMFIKVLILHYSDASDVDVTNDSALMVDDPTIG